jgi:uncharacterized protein (DUF2249 family)
MSTIGTTTDETIDIRLLGACADRKAHVLAAFDALRPGAFAWRVLEAGPVLFRVEIVRVA